MSWSYDPTDLNTTTTSGRLNTTRLLIGDTQTLDQQVSNEEVTFSLSENNNNVYLAGAWLARVIASKYARMVNTELSGSLKSEYSDLYSKYTALSNDLESQSKKSYGALGVVAGGITISDINSIRTNTDRVPPSFTRDQFHNPPTYSPTEYD